MNPPQSALFGGAANELSVRMMVAVFSGSVYLVIVILDYVGLIVLDPFGVV